MECLMENNVMVVFANFISGRCVDGSVIQIKGGLILIR